MSVKWMSIVSHHGLDQARNEHVPTPGHWHRRTDCSKSFRDAFYMIPARVPPVGDELAAFKRRATKMSGLGEQGYT